MVNDLTEINPHASWPFRAAKYYRLSVELKNDISNNFQYLCHIPDTDQHWKVRQDQIVMRLFENIEQLSQCLHQHLDLSPDNIQTVFWDSLVSALKKASLHEN
jgi:hypothetical protein